ncbi:MAG: DUF1838 family protein [Rhodospirillaceae bacterium]|nr:DUF1838 family protein [Rhodospirillaceae bacterium]
MTTPLARRTLLASSTALAVARPASARRTLDLKTPEDCLYAVVKLRGDLSGKMVYQWYTGMLSLLVPGKMPAPVARYQGIIRTTWTPQADGSFKYRTFDLGFYGDLETGRAVNTLVNPITGETVEPTDVRDGPVESVYSVNGVFRDGAKPDPTKTLSLPWVTANDQVWYGANLAFEYVNPLPPAQYPELSSTEKVMQRSIFTYKGRLSELEDDSTTSAPMETLMTVIATPHPWHKMGRIPGFGHIQTVSHKIARPEDAPPEVLDYIAKTMPDYLTAETPFIGAGNSFERYKRDRLGGS